MNVFVLNCGSSTVKFQLIAIDSGAMPPGGERSLARGTIENLGREALLTLQSGSGPATHLRAHLRDIREALAYVMGWLASPACGMEPNVSIPEIHAAGHRVVHGGEHFIRSTLLNEASIRKIEDLAGLAPLHNPANVSGIRAMQELLGPDLPQVAVFDTAFHQTLPKRAFLYAIPYHLYQRHGLRRYGFHGTSHRYVSSRYGILRNLRAKDTSIITLHLGNGCSVCAIQAGKTVDTSMGLTPLEGLVMGTRSGDVDPALAGFISTKVGLSAPEAESMLNNESGLLGVSGVTHDMRELLVQARAHDHRRAQLAIEIFCYRARKYIGAYLAGMGGADAIVFTGGIGENAPEVRERICEGLDWMGLELDQQLNQSHVDGREGAIHKAGSRLEAYVVPTNEELLIARDTAWCIEGEGNFQTGART